MRFVVGIDEVGRGSFAGPVTVAAVMMPVGTRIKNASHLRDSKKLTPKARQRWFRYLSNHPSLRFVVRSVFPSRIDRWNIAQAANTAALRACSALLGGVRIKECRRIWLDGGLYLGRRNGKTPLSRLYKERSATVVKGDEKIRAIAVASIIAKVTRDRYMVRLGRKYPEYKFEVHKGYGTSVHRDVLRRRGLTPAHRLTFCGSYSKMERTTKS